jgi:polar amino acid transport system substrate-binding protein
LNDPIVGWAEALAVQKGEHELLNFLNAWVTARKADRWLDVTREYWFESPDWMQEVTR